MLNDFFDSTKIPDHMFHDAVRETLSDRNLSGGSNNRPYNFRCPLCGDSSTNHNKKRGYVLYDKGGWAYVCHNACGEMSFLSFLKLYSPETHRKLCFHGFKKSNNEHTINFRQKIEKSVITIESVFAKGELIKITDDHPQAKQAFSYVQSRRIPESIWKLWFVCIKDPSFRVKSLNSDVMIGNEYGGRIIMPYYHLGGKWIQFDARALDPDVIPRYRNLQDVEREPYNIDWLDTSKPFFLLEGCIDSTFIPNSVAFGGTKYLMTYLHKYPEILKNIKNGTVIWDNDEAGRDELPKTIRMGLSWFDWSIVKIKNGFELLPDGTKRELKDINDLVLYGDNLDFSADGKLRLDSILRYIKKADGGVIMSTMLYGNRERMRRDKTKQIFEQMKLKRLSNNDVDVFI